MILTGVNNDKYLLIMLIKIIASIPPHTPRSNTKYKTEKIILKGIRSQIWCSKSNDMKSVTNGEYPRRSVLDTKVI
jgi:hypothetical protein